MLVCGCVGRATAGVAIVDGPLAVQTTTDGGLCLHRIDGVTTFVPPDDETAIGAAGSRRLCQAWATPEAGLWVVRQTTANAFVADCYAHRHRTPSAHNEGWSRVRSAQPGPLLTRALRSATAVLLSPAAAAAEGAKSPWDAELLVSLDGGTVLRMLGGTLHGRINLESNITSLYGRRRVHQAGYRAPLNQTAPACRVSIRPG